MSPENAKKLSDAADRAFEVIGTGANPTAAVVKVAKEFALNGHYVDRLCEVVNKGLHAYKLSTEAPDRRALPFATASKEQAMSAISGEEKAAAEIHPQHLIDQPVPDLYEMLDDRAFQVKAAADDALVAEKVAQDPRAAKDEIASLQKYLNKSYAFLKEAKNERGRQELRFSKHLKAACEWFIRHPSRYGSVKQKCLYEDPRTAIVFREIEKRASAYPLVKEGQLGARAEGDAFAYSCVENMMNALDFAHMLTKRSDQLREHLPKCQAQERDEAASLLRIKEAADGGMLHRLGHLGMIGQTLFGGILGQRPYSPNDEQMRQQLANLIPDAYNPEVDIEARKAKAYTLLHDFLANDEVISKYPKEEALQRFNELIEAAPDILESKAVFRDALRKSLQSGGEGLAPYEIEQYQRAVEGLGEKRRPKVGPQEITSAALAPLHEMTRAERETPAAQLAKTRQDVAATGQRMRLEGARARREAEMHEPGLERARSEARVQNETEQAQIVQRRAEAMIKDLLAQREQATDPYVRAEIQNRINAQANQAALTAAQIMKLEQEVAAGARKENQADLDLVLNFVRSNAPMGQRGPGKSQRAYDLKDLANEITKTPDRVPDEVRAAYMRLYPSTPGTPPPSPAPPPTPGPAPYGPASMATPGAQAPALDPADWMSAFHPTQEQVAEREQEERRKRRRRDLGSFLSRMPIIKNFQDDSDDELKKIAAEMRKPENYALKRLLTRPAEAGNFVGIALLDLCGNIKEASETTERELPALIIDRLLGI